MISRVLVANRGEIAVRIVRAARALGIETVVAASEADLDSLACRLADRVVCIGPPGVRDSYLRVESIVAAALGTGCEAVHPGYGFLAESATLAAACAGEGLVFVGPSAEQIEVMGNKLQARALATQCGLPVLPGSEQVRSFEEASRLAAEIGFPVMMKAAAGGGGRGMKIVRGAGAMEDAFMAASSEARAAFGDDSLYIERYIGNARHVEVQVLGDRFGHVVHLGERDCSMQRRHQKLIEESPAPALAQGLSERIRAAGVALARSMQYVNAGTVEFIVDQDAGDFFFLEMNTRIQVEHPVTEMVTGIDLVQEQFRVASGEALRYAQEDVVIRGHAIECRVNAEDPVAGFRPSPGRITEWLPPEGLNVRVDSHCHAGYTVPPYYDSMLAKLIVYGIDRTEALERMRRALDEFRVGGVSTTLPFLRIALADAEFASGRMNTSLVEKLLPQLGA